MVVVGAAGEVVVGEVGEVVPLVLPVVEPDELVPEDVELVEEEEVIAACPTTAPKIAASGKIGLIFMLLPLKNCLAVMYRYDATLMPI